MFLFTIFLCATVEDKILVATYEEGCPGQRYNDEGEDEVELKEYLSMPQQCYPFAISQGKEREEEEDNYYQAQEVSLSLGPYIRWLTSLFRPCVSLLI